MGLPAFTLTINQICAVEVVFPVGDLLDHGTRRFTVCCGFIRLQIGLGRIEPVETVLDPVFQHVSIPVPQPLDLGVIKLPLDGVAIGQALTVILEWRVQVACAFVINDPPEIGIGNRRGSEILMVKPFCN